LTINPGPSWHAIGTGDFNHDGLSDILFQNASSGQVSIWEMNGASVTGGGPISANPRDDLARYRNRRRRFGHPASKHERPNLDLGDERKRDHRRRAHKRQSRIELACDRADLTREVDRFRIDCGDAK
jgi:hypothetical protein